MQGNLSGMAEDVRLYNMLVVLTELTKTPQRRRKELISSERITAHSLV